MGLYESMELEVINLESGGRVANTTIAADLCTLTRGWDQVWSVASLMYAQMVNGLAVRVRRRKLGKKRYMRAVKQWMPNPAMLRREVDW